jgi:molybdenum cofactor cytidylyltransferase
MFVKLQIKSSSVRRFPAFVTRFPSSQDTTSGISWSALILAAGLSDRMGQPKALLMWDASRTFLEKTIGEYLDASCREVICTVNRFVLPYCETLNYDRSVRFILNRHPEWGRVYSVRLGLQELRESSFCFIQNVDNPFINKTDILKILDARDPEAWCSPEFLGRGGHPVLVPKAITEKILQKNIPGVTLRDILYLFPKKTLEMEDDSILRNINTPEEYRAFRKNRFDLS